MSFQIIHNDKARFAFELRVASLNFDLFEKIANEKKEENK